MQKIVIVLTNKISFWTDLTQPMYPWLALKKNGLNSLWSAKYRVSSSGTALWRVVFIWLDCFAMRIPRKMLCFEITKARMRFLYYLTHVIILSNKISVIRFFIIIPFEITIWILKYTGMVLSQLYFWSFKLAN